MNRTPQRAPKFAHTYNYTNSTKQLKVCLIGFLYPGVIGGVGGTTGLAVPGVGVEGEEGRGEGAGRGGRGEDGREVVQEVGRQRKSGG